MKKLLLILISVIIYGCSDNEVLLSNLSNQGTWEKPEMYYKDKLFSGNAIEPCKERDGRYTKCKTKIRSKTAYKNGKRNGPYLRFSSNSKHPEMLHEQSFYKDGKLDSTCTWWHMNGQVSAKINFKDGKRASLAEFYHEDGRVDLMRLIRQDYLWPGHLDEPQREVFNDPCELLEIGIHIMNSAKKLRTEHDKLVWKKSYRNGDDNELTKEENMVKYWIQAIEYSWFGDYGFEDQRWRNRWNPKRSPMRWCENLEEFERLTKISLASPDF